jgi:hypothetical protein
VEESAEEILARLERYVASVRARTPDGQFPVAGAGGSSVRRVPGAMPAAVTPGTASVAPASGVTTVDTLIPQRAEPELRRPGLLTEVTPGLLAVASCVLVLVAFESVDHVVAIVIAAAALLAGIVAVVRRVPFAGAWVFGLVVAGLLIRFS